MKKAIIIILSLFFILALLIFYSFKIEPKRISISHVAISSNKLNPKSPELKIVQISDIHMRNFGAFEKKIVDKVNSLNPDIIVITGDILKSFKTIRLDSLNNLNRMLDEVTLFCSSLTARLGIYAVRGNYEIVKQKEISDVVLNRLRSAGVTVLCNQYQTIDWFNNSFYLLGIDFHDFQQDAYADFKVITEDKNNVYKVGYSDDNAFAHYAGPGDSLWQDYEFTGRMKYNNTQDGGIGVTVYSHFLRGNDKFYRVRYRDTLPHFFIDAHNASIVRTETSVTPTENEWCRFKIRAETRNDYTTIHTKLWQGNTPEPRNWAAVVIDSSSSRIKGGTVGLWSHGEGTRYFDDLEVRRISDSKILMHEDFEYYEHNADPILWLDYAVDEEAIKLLAHNTPPNTFRILLSHSPDLVSEAAEHDIDLMLSGHTHGGQIKLPLIGALITHSNLGSKYSSGLFTFKNTKLYISRGLGNVLTNARFLCTPEITVFHISGVNY